jgi:hypothetical protein
MYYVLCVLYVHLCVEHEEILDWLYKRCLYTCLKAVASGGEKYNYGVGGIHHCTYITWCLFWVVTLPETSPTWVHDWVFWKMQLGIVV